MAHALTQAQPQVNPSCDTFAGYVDDIESMTKRLRETLNNARAHKDTLTDQEKDYLLQMLCAIERALVLPEKSATRKQNQATQDTDPNCQVTQRRLKDALAALDTLEDNLSEFLFDLGYRTVICPGAPRRADQTLKAIRKTLQERGLEPLVNTGYGSRI